MKLIIMIVINGYYNDLFSHGTIKYIIMVIIDMYLLWLFLYMELSILFFLCKFYSNII